MSISIPAPVANGLTVSFYAGNVAFNVSSVTFSGNTTSIVVTVYALNLGNDVITFLLTGTDSANYYKLSDTATTISVIPGNFIFSNIYYSPSLFVGQVSDQIPIRASISPIVSVTLTPYAANLIFTPATLTFRNGTEQQYFTITPLYSSAYATAYESTINWFISGADNTWFTLPEPYTVTIFPRYIQVAYSAHLITNNFDEYVNGGSQATDTATTRYLHKTYPIWVTVNYISAQDQVTVTPVNPYYSFSPATLNFDASHTRILLQATLIGLAPSGETTIRYIVGGVAGGLYNPVTDLTYVTSLRPLQIAAAVVSPDARSGGVFITSIENSTATYYFQAASVLGGYHVHSFLLRSFVLPDTELTITPKCPHATFSPSSITVKAKDAVKRIDYQPTIQVPNYGTVGPTYYFNLTGVYLEANFSVTALAAGTHNVWFELSGGDANYYYRPAQVGMTFNLVMRPSTEPFGASSSSFLFPSFLVVVVMATLALVM